MNATLRELVQKELGGLGTLGGRVSCALPADSGLDPQEGCGRWGSALGIQAVLSAPVRSLPHSRSSPAHSSGVCVGGRGPGKRLSTADPVGRESEGAERGQASVRRAPPEPAPGTEQNVDLG